jgi:hypothetical protein
LRKPGTLVPATCLAALLTAFGAVVAQGSVDLAVVLERMQAYVTDYETRLTGVVAEEHYDQRVESGRPGSGIVTGRVRERAGLVQGPTTRSLVSDFLMTRFPGEAAWFGFRDVLLVDGAPVRNREERLRKLFTENPNDVLARADLIAAESARHNIGGVERNINVPTQVLDFLHPRHSSRFSFRKAGEDSLAGKTLWRIAYEEREQPYLIRTPAGRGIRATGVISLDVATGAVLQTQLDFSTTEARQLLRTRITVVYGHDHTLGFLVPLELRESHEQSDPGSGFSGVVRLSGHARYVNFRRFRTETHEQLAVPAPDK